MRRVQLEGLEIERDRGLRVAGFQLRVAEIAPAGRQRRLQPQRTLVLLGCGAELAANHISIAELGMQFGQDVDGDPVDAGSRCSIKTAGVGGDRLADMGRVKLLSDQKLLADERRHLFGRGHRG